MFFATGYGLVCGLAVSALAVVAADNLGWLSAKLAPAVFGICLGVGGGIAGVLGLLVLVLCTAIAKAFTRPVGRPTVNLRVERRGFRAPRT